MTSKSFAESDYDIKDIVFGYECTMLLRNDGTVLGTAKDTYYQMGMGRSKQYYKFVKSDVDNVDRIIKTDVNTFVVKKDNTLWVSDYNPSGQFGIGTTGSKTTSTELTDNVDDIIVYVITKNLFLKKIKLIYVKY